MTVYIVTRLGQFIEAFTSREAIVAWNGGGRYALRELAVSERTLADPPPPIGGDAASSPRGGATLEVAASGPNVSIAYRRWGKKTTISPNEARWFAQLLNEAAASAERCAAAKWMQRAELERQI